MARGTNTHRRTSTRWCTGERRRHVGAAVDFLDATAESSRLEVLTVTESDEQAAFDWLRRHDERGYSFVDATSFSTMRRLGLREALAFDGDHAAAGFIEMRA
jgi:predicted nucleic acid-binding protein